MGGVGFPFPEGEVVAIVQIVAGGDGGRICDVHARPGAGAQVDLDVDLSAPEGVNGRPRQHQLPAAVRDFVPAGVLAPP